MAATPTAATPPPLHDGTAGTSARRRFPRGLEQPPGVFRHSLDALLLAAFVQAPADAPWRVADLGAGCGAVLCALGLRFPACTGVGVEVEPLPAGAARRNLARLDLDQRLSLLQADLADADALQPLGPGSFDLVAANPPYREDGRGRLSPSPLRRRALSAPPGTLEVFCRAARTLLRHHGRFCCVLAANRLTDLLDALQRQRLGLRRLRTVHSRPGHDAVLILAEARRDACPDPRLEAPLTLYAGAHGQELSPQALDFCPWLESQGRCP